MFDTRKLKQDPNVTVHTDKKKICGILREFLTDNSPVILNPIPGSLEFTTNVISANDTCIRIDSLFPPNGDAVLIKSAYIRAQFKLHGSDHYFITKLNKHWKDGKYYVFDLYTPIELLSLDKRKFFRVRPSLHKPVNIYCIIDDKYHSLNAVDVSEAGFSVLSSVKMDKFTILENVNIKIPENIHNLVVKGEVRYSV
ncbi:MAG: PilZ domain-containing protein, partial [bacterium]